MMSPCLNGLTVSAGLASVDDRQAEVLYATARTLILFARTYDKLHVSQSGASKFHSPSST